MKRRGIQAEKLTLNLHRDSERVIGNSTLTFCSTQYVNRKLRDSSDERKGKDAGKLELSSLELRRSVFFLEA